jgi:23S rRNA maturation-related 3'-5' exoribonuclease YhaM
MFINEMQVGDQVEDFFILSNAFAKQATNGKPFLSAVLQD